MKQEFLNETQINPMHFRILFQVSIWCEFLGKKKKKKDKTISNKWMSNKAWVPLEFPQYLPVWKQLKNWGGLDIRNTFADF